MVIADPNLATLLAGLKPSERRSVEAHVKHGRKTAASRELLRRIRASLKRKARNRLPKRLKWLG